MTQMLWGRADSITGKTFQRNFLYGKRDTTLFCDVSACLRQDPENNTVMRCSVYTATDHGPSWEHGNRWTDEEAASLSRNRKSHQVSTVFTTHQYTLSCFIINLTTSYQLRMTHRIKFFECELHLRKDSDRNELVYFDVLSVRCWGKYLIGITRIWTEIRCKISGIRSELTTASRQWGGEMTSIGSEKKHMARFYNNSTAILLQLRNYQSLKKNCATKPRLTFLRNCLLPISN
jgi:hypothetical protein